MQQRPTFQSEFAMLRLVVPVVALIAALTLPARADLVASQVAPDTYAITGPLGQRDAQNLGNNATFGLVVTPAGAVLIDAGGSLKGAKALHAAVRALTDQPVVVVINTGGQDHRWLGNGYWHEQGARIIASQAAVADQRDRVSMQQTVLATLIGADGLAGTVPEHADTTFADSHDFSLGGVAFHLVHTPAHTPGDTIVWLADRSTVFTGDLVYTERMAGVMPFSNARDWVSSFETMAALAPAHVVPGHGAPTDLATATRDTYDYLVALRAAIGAHIEAGGDIIGAPSVDQQAFSYLQNFDTLAGRNAQEVFSQMDWE
jgi:glyoxylase-like metal-dependent hydrolase (beta-lactamase superfamily II)